MFLAFPLIAGIRPYRRAVSTGLVTSALIGSFAVPAQAQSEADGPEPRTVEVEMTKGACDIERMSVSAGERVRFVLHNSSNLPRDFTVETALMQPGRSTETSKLTAMRPADSTAPEVVLIPPGETREVVRTFVETKDIELACNVPDHYEFGAAGASKLDRPADQDVVRASTEPLGKQKATLLETELPQSGKLAGSPAGELAGERDSGKKANGSAALRSEPVAATAATAALVVPPVRPQKKTGETARGAKHKEARPGRGPAVRRSRRSRLAGAGLRPPQRDRGPVGLDPAGAPARHRSRLARAPCCEGRSRHKGHLLSPEGAGLCDT